MLLWAGSLVFAQAQTVTGVVEDESGLALPGAVVSVKNTDISAATGADGRYSIRAGGEDVLVIGMLGFAEQEVPVNGRTTVDIVLREEIALLDELVVVGYATQKKVNLTGSVEQIDGSDIARQPVLQTSQALSGLSPGLTAIQSSGQPGADAAALRIRGTGSLTASNDPLVLIDGVEGDINGVDPADIQNISVLKDAASAAIYGSRASNGVILVTTKRATSGEMSIRYSTYAGWQQPTELPEYVGALDFLRAVGTEQSQIDDYAANMAGNPDQYPDTDWLDLVFSENGFQQYHNLHVNGGSEKARMLASISYMDQGGNIPNFGYKRYSGRLNSDFTFSEKFNVSVDLNFRKGISSAPTAGLSEITAQAFRVDPTQVAIHSDGSWGDGWGGSNPVAAARASGTTRDEFNYFRGIVRANYQPVDGLTLSMMYSPEHNDALGKSFRSIFTTITDWESKATRDVPNRNNLEQSYERTFQHNFNAVATYDKQLGDHAFTLLGGYEFIKSKTSLFGASRMDFVLDRYQELDAGAEDTRANNGSATQYGLLSFFGRLNYAFRDKYLFEANIRRDASSRFDRANRVSVFPSFSAGWRLSEEPFIDNTGLLSDLKLRASWGQLGNQQLARDFPFVSSIVLGESNFLFGDVIYTGGTQDYLANRDIRWETTETTNFGIDASLLDYRLGISAEYYIRKTKDMLLELPIPLVAGLLPSTQNAGNVENKGWDLSVSWRDKAGELSYQVGLNFSDVRNRVTDLANAGPIITENTITRVGQPIGAIFALETQGIFQNEEEVAGAPAQFGALTPGNLRYRDQNGDGIINADDRVILGDPFPKMTYGANLSAQYRNWDFSLALQGVGKRDVLLLEDAVWPAYNAGKVQRWHIDEAWSTENRGAKFPVLRPTSFGSNDARASSTWVFDASYLRIRNVSLGYTLPQGFLNLHALKELRIYFSGQNLFTFHKLPKGMDPLVPNGTNGAIYPVITAYTFGLNVQF